MKVLVTGATGFIGSHMADRLLGKGWETVCLARNPAALRHLEGKSVRIVEPEKLPTEFERGHGFDYIIHLAGATRCLDYRGYSHANVELTRSLLLLGANAPAGGRLKRFVLVSSQAAAGPAPEDGTPVTEADSPAPVSLYGRSKLEAERLAAGFMDRVPVTIVRPPTVFGPRDTDVLGVFRCARFCFAPCLAGPDRLVSIIYVQDLVDGILAAALAPEASGETYFLANPEPVIWREFSLGVARVMGRRCVALPVPLVALKIAALAGDLAGRLSGSARLFRTEKLEEMRQIAWVCSPEKAFRHLGWRAATPLDQAVRETAQWYRNHGWI